MRFTIHTPDGETYTTPEDSYPIPDNEGTGALHIIQSGSDRTIAMFPAGQWTRYVPTEDDAGEHRAETWDGLLSAVRTVIETKSKQLSNEQFHSVGDDANPYRTHRNATKHNKAGNR